jgi:uncharacterized phage protein gp47/JayE
MPRFTPQTTETIFAKMLARNVVMGGLTDITDTSVLKHFLMGFARALDEGYYQAGLIPLAFNIDTASGPDLVARAKDFQPETLEKLAATSAVATLVFSRSTVIGDVVIPTGTTVQTASGVTFITTADGTLSASSPAQNPGSQLGQDSGPVPAVATAAGSAGNVAVGTLVRFTQPPTGIDSVTNLVPGTGGTDGESDDSFRARIKNYTATLARSTEAALDACVLSATDPASGATILFSSVTPDPAVPGLVYLYVDDGTGASQSVATVGSENVTYGLIGPPANSAAGGEVNLPLDNNAIKSDSPFSLSSSLRGRLTQGTDYLVNYGQGVLVFTPALLAHEVITASYTYYTGIVGLAQKIVDGDPDNRTNYPGYRAAGIQVRVLPPQVLVPQVTASLTVAPGYDIADTYAAVQSAILASINALPISGDVLLSTLYTAVRGVDGVTNVVFSAPAADLVVLDNQIARTTIDNIVVN